MPLTGLEDHDITDRGKCRWTARLYFNITSVRDWQPATRTVIHTVIHTVIRIGMPDDSKIEAITDLYWRPYWHPYCHSHSHAIRRVRGGRDIGDRSDTDTWYCHFGDFSSFGPAEKRRCEQNDVYTVIFPILSQKWQYQRNIWYVVCLMVFLLSLSA